MFCVDALSHPGLGTPPAVPLFFVFEDLFLQHNSKS